MGEAKNQKPGLLAKSLWTFPLGSAKTSGLKKQTFTLPRLGDQASEVQVSQGHVPSTGSREAPSRLFQLLGLQASLPSLPLSPRGFSSGSESPLLCLLRTQSLDVGPP